MKRILMVHGMKRSGNHAVINWIQAHGSFLFLNNVIPIAPILQGQKTLPPTTEFSAWLPRNLFPWHPGLAGVLLKTVFRHRLLMLSLEDHELSTKPFRNAPAPVTNVLILRDPYNLFASRIRKASKTDNPAYQLGRGQRRAVQIWKQHAREYLRKTEQLEDCIPIYFNSWFSDEKYRRRASERLGFPFTDRGFSRISEIGGGSSFDSTIMNGDNTAMKVLDRKDQLSAEEQRVLHELLEDEDLSELAELLTSS